MELAQFKEMEEHLISNRAEMGDIASVASFVSEMESVDVPVVDEVPIVEPEIEIPEIKEEIPEIQEEKVEIIEKVEIKEPEPIIIPSVPEEPKPEIIEIEEQKVPEVKKEPQLQPATPSPSYTEQHSNGFLANKIGKQLSMDLRKAISLNDRFRFQRELFNGDVNKMNETLELLNRQSSLEGCMELLSQFNWNWEQDTALEFRQLLENKFL
jgi:hypothetical protein